MATVTDTRTGMLRLLCAGLVLTCGQAINPAFAEKIVVYHVNQATYGAAPVNMVIEFSNTFCLTIDLSVDDLINWLIHSFVFFGRLQPPRSNHRTQEMREGTCFSTFEALTFPSNAHIRPRAQLTTATTLRW